MATKQSAVTIGEKVKRPKQLMVLAVISLFAVGCGAEMEIEAGHGQLPPHLDDLTSQPVWTLTGLVVDGEIQPIFEDEPATFSFDAAELRVSGSLGCNVFDGRFVSDEAGSLQLTEYAVTEMACLGPVQQQEAGMIEVMSRVSTYRFEDETLRLTNGTDDYVMEFSAVEPDSLPLELTRWTLSHFTESDGETDSARSVDREFPIDLTINDGEVRGVSGCNHYLLTLTIRDGSFEFGEAEVTEKWCGERAGQQEENYLAVLAQMTSYRIQRNTLTMVNEDGTLGLQFEATEMEPVADDSND